MTLSRPGKPAQSNSSAIALIECSVKVSPTLARLIRKSAEKEMSGASAKDALLTVAGVQPGKVATLQGELQQASEESKRWREEAAREHGQLSQKSRLLSATTRRRFFSMTLVRRLPHLKGRSSKSSRSKHG
jgi:hypothetical protein